jgi:hypothetical protein
MTAPEVQWVLDQLDSVVTDVDTTYGATLRRVDRDESRVLETSRDTRVGQLEEAAYVGVALGDRDQEPIGTEYDLRLRTTVDVRIEGADADEFGEIDPSGADGVPFDELVRRCREAIYAGRRFPAAGNSDVDYTDVRVDSETDLSSNYADHYRADLTLLFRGYEDI